MSVESVVDLPSHAALGTDELFAEVERAASSIELPEGTYRLQFNQHFTFRDAIRIIPYLADLGITHVYASPFFKAMPGSLHGYDIIDHRQLNPEVGTKEDHADFIAALRQHELRMIIDFVPNHMGVASDENRWWWDVLENGPSSPYANYFDIDWMPLKPDLAHKVLLPVLGDQFGVVLEQQLLRLELKDGAFTLSYYGRKFPISPSTYGMILTDRLEELASRFTPQDTAWLEYQSICTGIAHLPAHTEVEPSRIAERQREKEIIKRRLDELCRTSESIGAFLFATVELYNGQLGQPRSFDRLDRLLTAQPYRLSFWRVAADEINYRRFFDVNDLAAITMERPEVFENAHALLFEWLDRDEIHGVRIDHADGLFDPTEYFWRLQQARFLQIARKAWLRRAALASEPSPSAAAMTGGDITPEHNYLEAPPPGDKGDLVIAGELGGAGEGQAQPSPSALQPWEELEPLLRERFDRERRTRTGTASLRPLYIVAEKILEPGERLPPYWPIQGTTGYDFLNSLGRIFIHRDNERAMSRIYERFIHRHLSYAELVYQSKKLVMQASMSSEISVLGHQLDRISERNRLTRDLTLQSLTDALREIIACFPVYRTYIAEGPLLDRDRRFIETAAAEARRRNPAINSTIFDFVRHTLLLHFPDSFDEEERAGQRRFVRRFQQMSGPIMAKGVEDTAFYIYNRLVSLNEVGGDAAEFGSSLTAFHAQNQDRAAYWPGSMVATSTHDTKRSEDVRARISVLSEIPAAWRSHVFRWKRLNRSRRDRREGSAAPSANAEYLLYQTLVGTWPTGGPRRDDWATYVERIQAYMLKGAREAKEHTSWINPDEIYERELLAFVSQVLSEDKNSTFLRDLGGFADWVAGYAVWTSLSQTLLKLASPGVPDLYQGSELWHICLVDPDNRGPVDYDLRERLLAEVREWSDVEGPRPELIDRLLAGRETGQVKLFVISQLLHYRRQRPGFLTGGGYVPLDSVGERREHVCAFVRRREAQVALAVAPRLLTGLSSDPHLPPVGEEVWGDAWLPLHGLTGSHTFRNILTGEIVEPTLHADKPGLRLADVLRTFPVAFLEQTG